MGLVTKSKPMNELIAHWVSGPMREQAKKMVCEKICQ